MRPVHSWVWISPHYKLICGAKDGIIDPRSKLQITCKNCLKKLERRKNEKTRIHSSH
jgi:hypothetical protein